MLDVRIKHPDVAFSPVSVFLLFFRSAFQKAG